MSDHIPDPTKMIQDTPRTDQVEKLAYWFNDDMTPVCESRFVRSLERELNAANAIIRQQQLLDEENLRLKDRIKRLEEAGDVLLRDNDDMANINRWHKAKYE
jgi:hypothetical protein